MSIRIIQGDCRDVLKTLDAESVDACVTDPPYHLTAGKKGGTGVASLNLESPAGRSRVTTGFMGKAWDGGDVAFQPETWAEVLRVLKPGGHLLAFGGTRTYHRLACAVEDAGFEIRDMISWIFGSGFPKSHNLHDDWEGWGTALKPALEPIVFARKPLIGTVVENVLKHGTGAINIEGCRVEAVEAACPREREPSQESVYSANGATNFAAKPGARRGRPLRVTDPKPEANGPVYAGRQAPGTGFDGGSKAAGYTNLGRWPANVVHDGSDEVVRHFPDEAGAAAPVLRRGGDKFRNTYGTFAGDVDEEGSTFRGDTGSAARFFYCAKASRADRDDGLDETFEKKPLLWSSGEQSPGTFQSEGTDKSARNNHPTVKPTELMRWLVRLVTPPKGLVLDPFTGSGSTGRACAWEGFGFLGIEMDAEYVRIAEARVAAAVRAYAESTRQGLLFG